MKKIKYEIAVCKICKKEFKRKVGYGRKREICFKKKCKITRNRQTVKNRYWKDKQFQTARYIPTKEDHEKENQKLRETSEDLGQPITWLKLSTEKFVERANLYLENGCKPVILKPLKRAILNSRNLK